VRFDRTEREIDRILDEQLFTCGAQVAVRHRGVPVLDLARGRSGTGRPLDARTIFRVYCSIKPVLTVAVARHVAEGRIDLDEPLADALDRPTRLPLDVTPRTVLTHTAGLHRTAAVSMEMLPEARRDEVVASSVPPTGWRVGRDAGYSEYAGWQLLGWLVADVAGEPLRDHLRTTVLDPLGLHDTFVGMTDEEYDRVAPRIGLNHEFDGDRMFPMVMERSRRLASETNPAHGGYTNASDLATFYDRLRAHLAGTDDPALPDADVLAAFCRTARPATYDVVLGRECEYGLGFMTSLAGHSFGEECGPESFGHSGNVGTSFGFTDPRAELAVGVVFNGLGGSDSAFLQRRLLVHAIYADLDLVAGVGPT
jgi:CubicO group peptidase (beta-lactamase class C family)